MSKVATIFAIVSVAGAAFVFMACTVAAPIISPALEEAAVRMIEEWEAGK